MASPKSSAKTESAQVHQVASVQARALAKMRLTSEGGNTRTSLVETHRPDALVAMGLEMMPNVRAEVAPEVKRPQDLAVKHSLAEFAKLLTLVPASGQ